MMFVKFYSLHIIIVIIISAGIQVYIIGTAVWVASVLGQFDDLYVNDYIGESIIAQIIDSTTFVHKSDIAGNGKVSMPEYLLFKLQELQMVDMKILDILSARFDELGEKNELTAVRVLLLGTCRMLHRLAHGR